MAATRSLFPRPGLSLHSQDEQPAVVIHLLAAQGPGVPVEVTLRALDGLHPGVEGCLLTHIIALDLIQEIRLLNVVTRLESSYTLVNGQETDE